MKKIEIKLQNGQNMGDEGIINQTGLQKIEYCQMYKQYFKCPNIIQQYGSYYCDQCHIEICSNCFQLAHEDICVEQQSQFENTQSDVWLVKGLETDQNELNYDNQLICKTFQKEQQSNFDNY